MAATTSNNFPTVRRDDSVFEERCGIITEEDQEAGTYYAYIELDQLDNDEFSVLVMAQEIESIDEVDHDECPDFVQN